MSRSDVAAAGAGTFDEELLQLLARQGRRLPVPLFILAAVIAAMAARHVGLLVPLMWLCLVVVVIALRWVVLARLPGLSSIDVPTRLRLAIILNALSGLTHGLSVVFFFVFSDYERAILSMLLIGLCAGSVSRTGGYTPVFLVYLIPTVVPLSVVWVVSAFSSDRPWIEASLALLVALLGGILAALARDAFRLFKESFDIRLQHVDLNERLRAALRDAEAASRAKTRFLASASHDLRQPMHSLTIFASALAMRPLDERSRGIVAHMNDALNELSSELDSLLDVSKLDAGLVPVHLEPVALKPLVERLRHTFLPNAQAKALALEVACPDDIYVNTDKTLLERALRNLLDNAIKYTDSGLISLAVKVDGDALQLVISDTGPGIPSAEHERVFEEFYQVGNPERDRAKGLGLGLAIVKRLLDLLQIRMTLFSTPTSGTRFTLTLHRASPAKESTINDAAAAPFSLHGLHVLVVDDELRIRLGMRELLEQVGCRVTDAASTAEAAISARLDRPDVLLADFRLRGADDGIATVRAVREQYPQLPALLVSGDTAPERLREADAAGLTQVLHKPVTADALKTAIGKAAGRIGGDV